MANSLQHISDKMMKMDINKLGAQSLGSDLIPAVPDKFLIKYDPPKICVVYHFKDHNEKDQYWRDIPLEVSTVSTANSVTDVLFKEHSYYFDSELIETTQVEKLVQMVINKNSEKRRRENTSDNSIPDFGALPENKPKTNKKKEAIEKARNMGMDLAGQEGNPLGGELSHIKAFAKKNPDPLEFNVKPKASGKVETKADDFDFLGLDDLVDTKPKEKESSKIEDDYDFDFEEIDAKAEADASNKKPVTETAKNDKKTEVGKKVEKPKDNVKDVTVPKEGVKPVEKKTTAEGGKDDKTEEDEYIVIDGKRFREIQIEGEEDEFLMDDDGNIYDKEGQYIGTAKDGEGDESEEEK